MQKNFTTYSSVLGLVIKELREKKELSQQDLAEKLKVTRVTVSKIENGQSDISTPIYLKLREIFCEESEENNIFSIADSKREALEKGGVTVYNSSSDVPKEQLDDNKTAKYIVGAAAVAVIIAFLAK